MINKPIIALVLTKSCVLDVDQILIIKVVSSLVYPLGMVLLLLLLAWVVPLLSRRNAAWGRRITLKSRAEKYATFFKVLSIALLLLASNPRFATWLMSSLEQQYPQQELSAIVKHDAIIVLGGGLRLPSSPVKHTQIGSGSDRYWYAVRLFKAGKANKIILSAGNVIAQPGILSEAQYAAELLQEWGVPSSAIAIETSSRNTQENYRNVSNYLVDKNYKRVLLVTSGSHMPRALQIFSQLPLQVTPASADIVVRDSTMPALFNWIPSAAALMLTTRASHEYYGMWASDIKALISSGW